MTDGLVFPIGHLVGQPAPGGYQIRIGRELIDLATSEFRVLGLAHGDPSRPAERPWTTDDLRTAASGIADLGSVSVLETSVSALEAKGALIEVPLDSPRAVEFARAYRLVPLMVGLGVDPHSPGRYALGFTLYSRPTLVLDATLYAVWRFAPKTTSLWDMAQRFAQHAIETGADRTAASETAVLRYLLRSLHQLLSHHAGYLDLAGR